MSRSVQLLKLEARLYLEKLLQHRCYFFAQRTHGLRSCTDILYSGQFIACVLDVGANIGRSAAEYLAAFPGATVHCFEPVRSTYEKLVSNVEGKRVHCYRLAMGSTACQSRIYVNEVSAKNSFIPQDYNIGSEMVDVTTVDTFSQENNIDQIDLLKIDTEGFDLEVLRGATGMLTSGRVAFVQVEVGFHPGDKRHVLFDDAREFLLDRGFSLFGIYEQMLEWNGIQRLRFANAIFHRVPPFVG